MIVKGDHEKMIRAPEVFHNFVQHACQRSVRTAECKRLVHRSGDELLPHVKAFVCVVSDLFQSISISKVP